MSIMMNTTINQKISPLLEPRSSLLEKTVRPRLHCSDPFVHLRLRLHLSRLRQEREKPEEHTHKQGLDITGAEDIRSHATTIIATSTTKYETHSCTSDGKKKRQRRRQRKKAQAVQQRKYQTKEEPQLKASIQPWNQTTQSRRSGGKEDYRESKRRVGWADEKIPAVHEPRARRTEKGIPYFLGHEQYPCNTMR